MTFDIAWVVPTCVYLRRLISTRPTLAAGDNTKDAGRRGGGGLLLLRRVGGIGCRESSPFRLFLPSTRRSHAETPITALSCAAAAAVDASLDPTKATVASPFFLSLSKGVVYV